MFPGAVDDSSVSRGGGGCDEAALLGVLEGGSVGPEAPGLTGSEWRCPRLGDCLVDAPIVTLALALLFTFLFAGRRVGEEKTSNASIASRSTSVAAVLAIRGVIVAVGATNLWISVTFSASGSIYVDSFLSITDWSARSEALSGSSLFC